MHGSSLLLRLPRAGLDGPRVGNVRGDGSLVFKGLSEWDLELYGAAPPRPDAGLPGAAFDAARASAALEEGAPYSWGGVASPEELRAAHAELEELQARGVMTSTFAGTTAAARRNDMITIMIYYNVLYYTAL